IKWLRFKIFVSLPISSVFKSRIRLKCPIWQFAPMRTRPHKMIEQPIFVFSPIDQPSTERNQKRLMGWGNNMAKICTKKLRAFGSRLGRTAVLQIEEKCSGIFAKGVLEI